MPTAAPTARFVLGPPLEPPPKPFAAASVICPTCGRPMHVVQVAVQAGNLGITCDRTPAVHVSQIDDVPTPPSVLLLLVCAEGHELQALFISSERGVDLWIQSVNGGNGTSAGSPSDCDAGGK